MNFIRIESESYNWRAFYLLLFNIIKWILSFIGLYYMYNHDLITELKIIVFFSIFLIVIFYILLNKFIRWYLNYIRERDFCYWVEEKKWYFLKRLTKEEKQKQEFQKLKEKWIKILKITVILSKIINPLFWILTQINVNWIFFCRWFNWKFYRFENFRKFIYFIFLYCFNYPILIVYWFFYRTLRRWMYDPIYKSIFERFTNLCISLISIIIIGEELYFFYRGKEIIFIFIIYIILIFISIYNIEIKKWKFSDFDIRFAKLIVNRMDYTILGQIIYFNSTFDVLNEHLIDDYYAWQSLVGKKRMLLEMIPIIILEMMNEIKYKPSFLYFSILNKYSYYFAWNNLYYGKNYFKSQKNKELAKQYEEEYFNKIKETLFVKWDILEYVFQTKDVVNWLVLDEFDEDVDMCCFGFEESLKPLCGDDTNKLQYYNMITNYKNIEEKFLDLGENLEIFCNKLWFHDCEFIYKFERWEIEICKILMEEDISLFINDVKIKEDRYNEYRKKFEEIQKEWKEKHMNEFIIKKC